MKDISQVSCLVVDSGLFLPFALRMAESCKRVVFWNPDQRGFPSVRQGMIGKGFERIEHVLDPWPIIGEVDLACFPDVGHAGLQLHLESIGLKVWGSRAGDRLELNREFLMRKLGQMGLNVPPHEVLVGLDALRDYLKEHDDVFVKVSRWRGDMETHHWTNWAMCSGWLDWLAFTLGPMQKALRFLVFDKIDTPLEIGGDAYFVGNWPALMLSGSETKDRTYFSAVTPREEMPEQIQEIMVAVAPYLRDTGYANQISFEDRVTDDGHWWCDATNRGGLPSSASQYRLWENWPEIVWAGANRELVDPTPSARFSIECQLTAKPEHDAWVAVEIPEGLVEHCCFSYCGFLDGCYVFPPDEHHHGELGWLVATENTPVKVLELAKGLCDELPDGVDGNVEGLVDLIKEYEQAEKLGLDLSPQPMPDIGDVVS